MRRSSWRGRNREKTDKTEEESERKTLRRRISNGKG
jgi:hypothetical protein